MAKKVSTSTQQGRLFEIPASDPAATGKNIASLENSRNGTEELTRMFRGDIPSSVMRIKRDEMDTNPVLGSYTNSGIKYVEKGDKLYKVFSMSGKTSGHGKQKMGALPIFARNICRNVGA